MRLFAPRLRQAAIPVALYAPLFLIGAVVLWTLLSAISHSAPDKDNIEELVWASSFEWGYFKHPPVPSWILYPLVLLFGKSVWLTFFAGQSVCALGLWLLWKFGCEFTTPRRSLIAMLMVSVTAYFSIRADMYNHNSVQMWSIVASTWLYYRALRYQHARDWLWLGAACGVAFLTKYSALIQFAAFFVFFVYAGHWRDRRAWRGAAMALAVFLLVISPHIHWLIHHHFGPLHYADTSIFPTSGGSFSESHQIAEFLSTQLGRLSPMLVAWLAVAYWQFRASRRSSTPKILVATRPYARALSAWDRSFLVIVGGSPVLLTVTVSAFIEAHLGASWATTFFVLFGFYTFWWLGGDEREVLRRTAITVMTIQILMAAGYAIGRGPLAYHTGMETNSTYPGSIISRRMRAIWHQYVPTAPLTLVAAHTWLGGNIAIHMHPSPEILEDGKPELSPWIKSHNPLRCGALIAMSSVDYPSGATNEVLNRLYEEAPYKGVIRQRWSAPTSPLITIRWAVIPPTTSCTRYASF